MRGLFATLIIILKGHCPTPSPIENEIQAPFSTPATSVPSQSPTFLSASPSPTFLSASQSPTFLSASPTPTFLSASQFPTFLSASPTQSPTFFTAFKSSAPTRSPIFISAVKSSRNYTKIRTSKSLAISFFVFIFIIPAAVWIKALLRYCLVMPLLPNYIDNIEEPPKLPVPISTEARKQYSEMKK